MHDWFDHAYGGIPHHCISRTSQHSPWAVLASTAKGTSIKHLYSYRCLILVLSVLGYLVVVLVILLPQVSGLRYSVRRVVCRCWGCAGLGYVSLDCTWLGMPVLCGVLEYLYLCLCLPGY